MSQKDLNYIEDIYNHEKLIVDVLYDTMERIEDEQYVNMFDKQIENYNNLMKKTEKMLGDYNE